jgi:hypothetical protein
MTHLLHNPRLLRKYIDKKQEQLQEILEELEALDLEEPARFRLLELMLYLQKGIPELEQVYGDISKIEAAGSPNTDRSTQTGSKDTESLPQGLFLTPIRTEKTDRTANERGMAELHSKIDRLIARMPQIPFAESTDTSDRAAKSSEMVPELSIREAEIKSSERQLFPDWDQLSKGVREGRTVDLLYKQLSKLHPRGVPSAEKHGGGQCRLANRNGSRLLRRRNI